MKLLLNLILIVSGVFLLIQVLPYGRDHTNPPVVQEPGWATPEARQIAQRACFDCHSNETVWPWYANVAPVSWLLQRDVTEGREVLNFSDWTGSVRGGREDALEEIADVLEEGEMPPPYYYPTHPNARLSSAEKQAIIDGLR